MGAVLRYLESQGYIIEGEAKGVRLGRLHPDKEVYCVSSRFGRLETVKAFRLTEDYRAKVIAEAQNLGQLSNPGHEGIQRYIDVEEQDGLVLLRLEYVPGETLTDIMKNEFPLAGRRVMLLMERSANALAYAHSHGIIHRDIKPSNIIVKQDDLPVLIDFGIGKYAGSLDDVVGGSQGFMAPKQRRGESDESTDVYALGAVLHYLLTGKPPEIPFQDIPAYARLEVDDDCQNLMERVLRESTNPKNRESIVTAVEFAHAVSEPARRRERRVMTRRKFLSIGGAAAASVLSGVYFKRNDIRRGRQKRGMAAARDAFVEEPGPETAENLLQRILDKEYRFAISTRLTNFPYSIAYNNKEYSQLDGMQWCSGYWPAILWTGVRLGDLKFLPLALKWSRRVVLSTDGAGRSPDYLTTAANRFMFSHADNVSLLEELGMPDEALEFRDAALDAARVLSMRYNAHAGCIQEVPGALAVKPRHSVSVDSSRMALPLLCWASEHIPEIRTIIDMHIKRVEEYIIREDGRTYQMVLFDPASGDKEVWQTHASSKQGCYARGQARAMNGMLLAYQATEKGHYLSLMHDLSRAFPYEVPAHDLTLDKARAPLDSSSAALAAQTLLQAHERASRRGWREQAISIMTDVTKNCLITDPLHEGVLTHVCRDVDKKGYDDCSTIYADYDYVRALYLMTKKEKS